MSKKKLKAGEVCPECGAQDGEPEFDPFGCGDLLDVHMDTEVDEEELAKRLASAAQMSKQLAGTIAGGFLDELGLLSKPKLTWQDFIRSVKQKKQRGEGKSDWAIPKRRPLFAGLFNPTKKNYRVKFLAAIDTSGSMSNEDLKFGLQQIQALDDKGEGYVLSWDVCSYWEEMIKIKKADKEHLQKAVIKGRGGTSCASVFNEYEDHCERIDIIIVITDGFLMENEFSNVKRPPKSTEVLWLITSHNPNFKPPFGRVMHLHNE